MRCPYCKREFARPYKNVFGNGRYKGEVTQALVALPPGVYTTAELSERFPQFTKQQLKNGAAAMRRYKLWKWLSSGKHERSHETNSNG